VETGMLIDIEHRFGLSCMAQVDLKCRIHRNQPLEALRNMAFGILRVMFMRAEQQGKLFLLDTLRNQLMTTVQHPMGYFDIDITEINEMERPPMILNPDYQKKRRLSEEDLILLEEIRKQRRVHFVPVSQFMEPALIVLDGQATNKEDILKEISHLLFDLGIARDYPRLVHEFFRRENTLSTGIGSGIAIPHVISRDITRMRVVVYRPEQPVQFNSPDGQPVNLIFAVVSSPNRRLCHLQTLANMASILRDGDVRNKLLYAETPEEFISMFRKVEVVKRIEQELRAIES
jgi:mannitol/fructose-specific phosphotransferase system IIA component (Ntr-type)